MPSRQNFKTVERRDIVLYPAKNGAGSNQNLRRLMAPISEEMPSLGRRTYLDIPFFVCLVAPRNRCDRLGFVSDCRAFIRYCRAALCSAERRERASSFGLAERLGFAFPVGFIYPAGSIFRLASHIQPDWLPRIWATPFGVRVGGL
jgi:hypothetical protein